MTRRIGVEKTRTHYARSHGDPKIVSVAEPLVLDLELPESYAKDLLADLRRAIAGGGDPFERAELALDVPFRVKLRPLQIERLVHQLAEVLKEKA